MDIQSYINSGRVEHFVLGLSSPDDAREMERFAAEHPAFRAEIERIHEALAKLASANAIQPPSGLKAKIMTEIDRLAAGQPERPRSKPAEPVKKPVQQAPTEDFAPRQKPVSFGFLWGWAAAALVAIGAAYLWKQNSDLNTQLDAQTTRANEAVAKYDQLEKDCSAKSQHEENLRKQIAFARDAATKSVVLRGVEKSPNSVASVIFNAEKKQAFIEVNSLPAPPTGKQYQLWAIRGEEKVSMGVFDLPKVPGDFIAVPFVDSPDAFAVTLENQGGSGMTVLSSY